MSARAPQSTHLPAACDILAPDGSEIRLLLATARASMVHATLNPGQVSLAVLHRAVEEIWYCLSGQGELWRRLDHTESVTPLAAGIAITLPVGTHFQFRATGDTPLTLLIATIPPWPGEEEAVRVADHWPVQ
jgi:mannose-6-phosphate isomerase-like protein (cupin superfamily)